MTVTIKLCTKYVDASKKTSCVNECSNPLTSRRSSICCAVIEKQTSNIEFAQELNQLIVYLIHI